MATDYSQYNWDNGGMGPDELDGFRDNIINTFLQKASSVINAEQDPAKKAKMEAALENRVNAISGAFDKYGPTAFDPNLSSKNQHPEDSSLDVPNYMPSNFTGDLPNSPSLDNATSATAPQQKEGGGLLDTWKALNAAGEQAVGTALATGARTIAPLLSNLANPTAPDIVKEQSADQIYKLADTWQQRANEAGQSVKDAGPYTDIGRFIGGAIGSLGTGGIGMFGQHFENVANGANPYTEAAKTAVTTAPEYAATLGLNAFKGGLLTRMAKAVPSAVGINVAGAAAENALGVSNRDPFSLSDNAAAAGLGAFAALTGGGTARHIEDTVVPPKGNVDPDINAGIQAGKQATEQSNPGLYSNNEAVSLYSGKPENVPTPETTIPYPTWKDLNTPKASEINVDTTSDILKNRDIDQAWQQKAADEAAVKNLIPDILDELSPKTPVEETLPTVSDLASKEPVPTNNAFASNPELKSLYDDLTLQRAKEQAAMPEDPNVELTTNKDPIDSKPRTMFKYKGKPQPPEELNFTGEPGTSSQEAQVAPKAALPLEEQSKNDLLSSLDEKLKSVEPAESPAPYTPTDYQGIKNLPSSVTSKLADGTLSADHIIDAFANNDGNRLSAYPSFLELAKGAQKIRDTLGGGDAKVGIIPKDPTARTPEQQAWVDGYNQRAVANGNDTFDKVGGIYSEADHTIKINGIDNATPDILLHEAVHPLTNAALEAGRTGKLTGERLQGYKNLQNIFDALKPEISGQVADVARSVGKSGGDSLKVLNVTTKLGYGLKNLHELASEMHSNTAFVNNLKRIDPETLLAKAKGTARWLPLRMALAKARNGYEAVSNAIKKMLGLNAKAANAYDLLQGHFHGFVESFKDAPANETPEAIRSARRAAVEKHLAQAKESAAQSSEPFSGKNNPLKYDKNSPSKFDMLRNLFLGERSSEYGKVVSTAKERYSGAVQESLRTSNQLSSQLKDAMKADGMNTSDSSTVLDYIHNIHSKDPQTAAEAAHILDSYPKVKALVTDTILPKLRSNELRIVKSIRAMDNPTKADLMLAHTILDNPGYTMREYNSDSFSKNLLTTGLDAIKKGEGAKLTPEQEKAKTITNNALDYINKNVLPNESMSRKNLNGLRSQAKYLGLDTVKTLTGIKTSAGKKAALIKAINDAVPDAATADRMRMRVLYEIAGVINKTTSPVASYLRGARLGDITKTRANVPEQLKALWGELKDAPNVLAHTMLKQDRAIAQYKQQFDINKGLEGKYLFDTKASAPDYATEQLTGRQYGALRGKWTTPEVARMVRSQLNLNVGARNFTEALMSGDPVQNVGIAAVNKLPRAVRDIISSYKLFRYATDPGYYIMFAGGSPSILLQNGAMRPGVLGRGVAAQIGALSPKTLKYIKAKMPELGASMEKDISLLTKSGMGDPAMAGEVFDQMLADKVIEATRSGSYRSQAEVIKHYLGSVLKNARAFAATGLSMTDQGAKNASFLRRMDVLKDHYAAINVPKTEEEIRLQAMDEVKDTTATNSRSPLITRLAERYGGTTGLMYNVETVRNAFNSFARGFSDISEGLKTGDKAFALHGLETISGSATSLVYMGKLISMAAAVPLTIAGMASKAISPTDKRQEYLQQEGSYYRGQRPEEITDPNSDSKTKYLWAPGDYIDYNYASAQAIHVLQDAWAKHEAGQEVEPTKLARDMFGGFLESFLRNSLVSKLSKVVTGNAPGWERNEAPKKLQGEIAFWMNNLGLSENAAKRMVALSDVGTTGFQKNLAIANEAEGASPAMKLLLSLGVGVKTIPEDTGLKRPVGQSSTSTRTASELNTAKQKITNALTDPADINDSTLDKLYKKAFKESYDTMTKLNNAYDFARANGVSEGSLLSNSIYGGTPEKAVIATMYQKQNPAYYLYQSLSGSMKSELKKSDPSEYSSIIQRYTSRQRHLLDLTLQYSKLTPEQIKEL